MRRMVGAAILVAVVTGLGWLRQPTNDASSGTAPIIDTANTAVVPVPPPDSLRVLPAAIDHLSDPLAFLSTAGADSLDLLPGIGPVLAARLIAAREQHGAFRSWDDVDRVRGIGPKTIERLRALADSALMAR